MAGLRFTEVQSRPTEFLDLTSLTLDGHCQGFRRKFQCVDDLGVSCSGW
jgi:hypothetical protein